MNDPQQNGKDPRLGVLGQAFDQLVHGDARGAEHVLAGIKEEPRSAAKRGTISATLAARVFARDHYICAYCGRRTICPAALRYLSERFPALMPYHPHWKVDQTHSLYWDLTASCDHRRPVAYGGLTDRDNLVTACWKCNSLKAYWRTEELETRPVSSPDTGWDGLSGDFLAAMAAEPSSLSYLLQWKRALKAVAASAPTSPIGVSGGGSATGHSGAAQLERV